jgi:hypothetical protein
MPQISQKRQPRRHANPGIVPTGHSGLEQEEGISAATATATGGLAEDQGHHRPLRVESDPVHRHEIASEQDNKS